jgi:hypothetical protein
MRHATNPRTARQILNWLGQEIDYLRPLSFVDAL